MILKKGRLASLRAVRRGLGVAAGYLSSGTLWGGFEFRIASRKPRSSGLARSGAILPLSAARLPNVAPTRRFGRQRDRRAQAVELGGHWVLPLTTIPPNCFPQTAECCL